MRIFFNEQHIETSALILKKLLEEQRLSEKVGIAVAINDEVIPRVRWNDIQLQENDRVFVITAAAGG